ncbi:HAD family hydrolase [Micromonospora echinospora]|uniref:HAD family hydrolase n=1 Tax=Micromonospora echinospora TaxID=1877 RepID=UPI003CEE59E0
MPPPRLVATDLDGTIVGADRRTSGRTRRALSAVLAADAAVVLASGRTPRKMRGLAALTGVDGVAIGANGAVLYDLRTDRIVSLRLMEPPTLREVAARLAATLPGVAFGVEYGEEFGHEPHYRHARNRPDRSCRVAGYARLTDRPAVKLVAQLPVPVSDRQVAQALAVVGGLASLAYSSPGALEVAPAGVTKASALAELCAGWRVDARDVVAFGDMPNDIAMLAWAGLGVAVGNADPAVRAVADRVTGSVGEDGVAVVLEELFPVRSTA